MPDGTFQLGDITQSNEGVFDKFMEKYITKEKSRGRLISCYKFQINQYLDSEIDKITSHSNYKVKIYHMDDDEFKPVLYPYSWRAFAQYKWNNRRWFRIL